MRFNILNYSEDNSYANAFVSGTSKAIIECRLHFDTGIAEIIEVFSEKDLERAINYLESEDFWFPERTPELLYQLWLKGRMFFNREKK